LAAEPPRRVADFIDTTIVTWREEKLREFLLPIDVDIIVQIPVSTRRLGDI
jgi:hypothetical protein